MCLYRYHINLAYFNILQLKLIMFLFQASFRFLFGAFGTLKPIIFQMIKCKNYSVTRPTSKSFFLNWKFVPHENLNAHNLLQGLPPYQTFVLPHPRVRIEKNLIAVAAGAATTKNSNSNIHVSKTFQRLLISMFSQSDQNPKRISEMFGDSFFASLCGIIPKSSDEDIIDILSIASLWPQSSMNQYLFPLFKIIDQECCKRFQNWSIEKKLSVADIYFHLYISHNSVYITQLIDFLSKDLKNVSKPHLIYLLFQMNLKRQASSKIMEEVEKQLERVIDVLSIEEISVVALGYFKTSNRIKSNTIIKVIIDKVMSSINQINSTTLVAVLKVLQISYTDDYKLLIAKLLRKANLFQTWKKDFQVAAHLCNLACIGNIYVPELIENVIQEMPVAEHVRLKDMSRVLLSASKFGHNPVTKVKNFYITELQSSNRKTEIENYPLYFLSCLLYLSMYGTYNEDLLNQVFSSNYINLLLDKKSVGVDVSRDLATLDCFVELDVPTYAGCRLDFKTRFEILSKLQRHFPSSSRKCSFQESVTLDILHGLGEIINIQLKMVHILPYMLEPVILLMSDKRGCFQAPSEDIHDLISRGKILSASDERKWIVVWPISKNSYIVHTHRLKRTAILKYMHLEKLGYIVVKIDTKEYNSLTWVKKLERLKRELQNL